MRHRTCHGVCKGQLSIIIPIPFIFPILELYYIFMKPDVDSCFKWFFLVEQIKNDCPLIKVAMKNDEWRGLDKLYNTRKILL